MWGKFCDFPHIFLYLCFQEKTVVMLVKFLIKKQGKRNKVDDLAQVYMRVRGGRSVDVTVMIDLKVNPLWWDEKTEEYKTRVICPDKERKKVRNDISAVRTYVKEQLDMVEPDVVTKKWLEGVLDKHYHPEKYDDQKTVNPLDFEALFDEFMIKHPVSEVRAKNNRVVKRAVMRFELFRRATVKGQKKYFFNVKTTTPEILDDLWNFFANEHQYFKDYPEIYEKIKEKRPPKPRGENCIIDMMSRLRTFFNWCVGKYIEVSPFKNYSIPEPVYGTPVFITTSELNTLAKLDLSDKPDLEVQRDIFVFQCCVGCRVGDLYRMTRSNIVNGVLYYIAGKTKDDNPRTLAVPLVSMAMDVVDKYEDPKRATLFPFIHEQYYNIAIKEIFKLAGINRVVTLLDPTTRKEVRVPISEYASSHMARRTFCGNVYKNVKDPSIVGSMSGHKEGSKALARYRDIDQDIKKDALSVFE